MKIIVVPTFNSVIFPKTMKLFYLTDPVAIEILKQAEQQQQPVAIASYFHNEETCRRLCSYGAITFDKSETHKGSGKQHFYLAAAGRLLLDQALPLSESIYVEAEGQPINFDYEFDPSLAKDYQSICFYMANWANKFISDVQQRNFFIKNLGTPYDVISTVCSYMVKDADLQYELLEINSINQQIRFLHRLAISGELIS